MLIVIISLYSVDCNFPCGNNPLLILMKYSEQTGKIFLTINIIISRKIRQISSSQRELEEMCLSNLSKLTP